MTKIKLILVDEKYSEQYEDYKKNMIENDSSMDGCGNLREKTVNNWIKESLDHHKGINIPEGRVPATQLVALNENDKVVGMLQIRHNLKTEYLEKFGGHIGYSVRCDERRKGYAKEMLKQALPWCKKLGIDKVLITCKKENVGSSKTILANGGVFESEIKNGEKTMLRYWIDVK